jgi:subtilisin family serine protease
VINISGGFLGFDSLLEQGVDRALRRGAIVVAAVGNDRQSGNRSFVPASLPHVLTVGATDQSDRFAFFSNRSSALDLAAPGVSIPVAVPTFFNASGFASFDGTSFSAPLVAGAAAWVWTVRPDLDPTQLEDIMRNSARDVGPKGWDADTGFGILSIPAALAAKIPAKGPTGAERRHQPRASARRHRERDAPHHSGSPAGAARRDRGSGGRLPRLGPGPQPNLRQHAQRGECQRRALGPQDPDRLRAGQRAEA